MLVFGSTQETLPITVELDPTSGLPLFEEREAIAQYILAYLALPYSIADYGCGKKVSLIIEQLLQLNIPPYAVSRSLLLEPDLSDKALQTRRWEDRHGALSVANPLAERLDLSDERLHRVIQENCEGVRADGTHIAIGDYTLTTKARQSFEHTRSHVMTLISFWDQQRGQVTHQVLDPSLKKTGFFPLEECRHWVQSKQALLFEAPLLGHFRLNPDFLTAEQQQRIHSEQGISVNELSSLSQQHHDKLVLSLTGASEGSIGDPTTWSYANNARLPADRNNADSRHWQQQRHRTGEGDELYSLRQQLFTARAERSAEASDVRARLVEAVEQLNLTQQVEHDAVWSVKKLQPLADVATQLVYFNSLRSLSSLLVKKSGIAEHITDTAWLQSMRGLGVRLRRRIDQLAEVSRARDERIDARALNQGFCRASVATIKQMNRAGLTVYVDKVGNLHGLLLSRQDRQALKEGRTAIGDYTHHALAHGSHIDTVNDAGKFDGRLGVLSGLDTLHTLHDLYRLYDLNMAFKTARRVMVTAFIGEEMTFTGNRVSMPGSAAIAGRASIEQIHGMQNGDGEVFKVKLLELLKVLQQAQQQGRIELANNLAVSGDEQLVDACSDPQAFYTPYTYERHIEQGPVLDRAGVPTALVETIMGIHQEDFVLEGPQAETAALLLDHRLRLITTEEGASDARITVGIIEGQGHDQCDENIYPALRWTLEGEMNHAGATPTADRKDPGVAAGRLTRYFLDWFNQCDIEPRTKARLSPSVANVRLTPGTNRNVIPAKVSFTTALIGHECHPRQLIGRRLREDLTQTLEGYVIGTLGRRVESGGEGIRLCRVEPVSYSNSYRRVRLTLDLRCASQALTRQCLESVSRAVEGIERECGVDIQRQVQQQLPPFGLSRSGQVLLMERSYGGSHNPRETEMLADILRGSVLQLDTSCHFLSQSAATPVQLFDYVDDIMPRSWRSRLSRYTSGALHDTCNIAARAQQQAD